MRLKLLRDLVHHKAGEVFSAEPNHAALPFIESTPTITLTFGELVKIGEDFRAYFEEVVDEAQHPDSN
jgi:hypothetical protein